VGKYGFPISIKWSKRLSTIASHAKQWENHYLKNHSLGRRCQTVHIDFYGPLPAGEYLLVAMNRYSRYPEVEVVRSTKASTVIPKLDQMFARHGIPTIIKSDNGPLFNDTEYKHYLEVLGIKAKFSTPKWPQGNAEAERFMQPLCKDCTH
jgi:transposase InsO family protein